MNNFHLPFQKSTMRNFSTLIKYLCRTKYTLTKSKAEQRTSSTKARLQSPATVKDKPIEAPDLRFIYVDQLPTPGSSSNSHKAEPEEMAPTEKADVDGTQISPEFLQCSPQPQVS